MTALIRHLGSWRWRLLMAAVLLFQTIVTAAKGQSVLSAIWGFGLALNLVYASEDWAEEREAEREDEERVT